jgi:hypothetical protein
MSRVTVLAQRQSNALRAATWLTFWLLCLCVLLVLLSGCTSADRQRIREAATGAGAKDTAAAVCALAHAWDGKTTEVEAVRTVCAKAELVKPWAELAQKAAELVKAQRAGNVRPDPVGPSSGLDVRPGAAVHDRTDRLWRDAVLPAEGRVVSSLRSRTDGAHVVDREWRLGVPLALKAGRRDTTVLFSHVPKVVRSGSFEEVVDANATRVVASVAQAVDRPGAVRQEPGDAVCETRALPVPADAVACLVGCPRPVPARLGLFDPLPKPSDASLVHGDKYSAHVD